MVHFYSFHIKGADRKFIWDTESGSLHNVDNATFLIAKKRFSILSSEEELALSNIHSLEKEEIFKDLERIEAEGALNTKEVKPFVEKRIGRLKAMCLHICHDCNLRCKYCFADEGKYHSKQREAMSFEVGKNAVDYLVANSGDLKNLEIDFFGGEPLMNLDVVKKLVKYARNLENTHKKLFYFTITTNCLLLNDKNIEYLNKEMHNVVLSVDGRKEIHNAVRVSASGKDCYDVILNNALKFAKVRGEKSYYVRGTFTSENLDFAEDIKFLSDLGVKQLSLEPVVLPETHSLAIKKEHLPIIFKEYEKLADLYFERLNTEKWFNFFHFMLDLEQGPCINKRVTGCGAGCEYVAVTPNGDVFPCHQFADKPEYKLGNVLVDQTIDLNISKIFAKNTVFEKQNCNTCPAKYFCSGGCSANNLNFSNDMHLPYELSCEMMKKRFELSLKLYILKQYS